MQLSPNFSLEEFTRSATAVEMGNDNAPRAEHLQNLEALAAFLEKVRTWIGDKPIRIESAYRNPEVNARVGGVPNSDHCLGLAADIEVPGMTDFAVCLAIRDSDLQFDQLIREDGRTVHVSINPRMRRQVLRQPGGPGSPVYAGLTGGA